jgi:hypothetical protein
LATNYTSCLSSHRITPGLSSITECLSNPKYLLPEKVDNGEMIDICISDIVECGLFWAQIKDEAHVATLSFIQEALNSGVNQPVSNHQCYSKAATSSKYPLKLISANNLFINMLCVTGYAEPGSTDTQFYRAQITHLNKEEQTANVLFIDFGNREKKKLSQLFELSAELQEYPFQAIQCKIANIKMSLFKNPNGTWTKAATSKFSSIVNNELNKSNVLKLRILHLNKANVGYCTLYSYGSDGEYCDIGQRLVESGYADAAPIDPILKKKSSSSHYLYVPSRKSD